MVKEILEMASAEIIVAAAAAAFLLIFTVRKGLSKDFYEKGFSQVMGGLIAAGAIKEFCKGFPAGSVMTAALVVFIVVVPAAVFQAMDCRRMMEKKETELKEARAEIRRAERAVDRVKAARKERMIRKKSIFRYS